MLNFTTDQWVIVGLIFLLGLVTGGFLFSGGGRKWKQRYQAEKDRIAAIETRHAAAEKEWRERDALRAAALREAEARAPAGTVAVGTTGTVAADPAPRSGILDRMLGRDRDADGVHDRVDPAVDTNRDGIDDRRV